MDMREGVDRGSVLGIESGGVVEVDVDHCGWECHGC